MFGMTPSGELQVMCEDLDIDDDMLGDFMQGFMDELELGLTPESRNSSLKCFLTHVQDIPAGYEKGQFLSLDFCSPDVKVSIVTLRNKSFDLQTKRYTVPAHVFQDSAEHLFDFLAECVHNYLLDNRLHQAGLPMGVTFGFPCDHRSLKSAILLEWTKEIKCSGAVGSDIVAMLEKSISKRSDLDVKVQALINDSTEALIATMWKTRKCKLAVIVDCGNNVSYVERIESISKYTGDTTKPCMIINIESGNFGTNGTMEFIRTDWDRELDAKTQRPGKYLLDKMTGKYYMGELVRRIVLSAVQKHIMFKGSASPQFTEPWSVDPTKIIEISKDWSGQAATRNLLRSMGVSAPTPQDCVDFRFVCQRVWTRSAHLSAAAVSAVLQYMRCKQVGIGYSGALLLDNPRYLDVLRSKVRQLMDPRVQFQFVSPEGATGIGAALAACVANTDIAMFTEQLEEPDDVFYSELGEESFSRKPRKNTNRKFIKVASETTLQLTPKRNVSHTSKDSILKKVNEPPRTPDKPYKRRSVSSQGSGGSKSNADGVMRKPSLKVVGSKHESKERQGTSFAAESANAKTARSQGNPKPGSSGRASMKRSSEHQRLKRDVDTLSNISGSSRDDVAQRYRNVPLTRSPITPPSQLQTDRAVSNIGASTRRGRSLLEAKHAAAEQGKKSVSEASKGSKGVESTRRSGILDRGATKASEAAQPRRSHYTPSAGRDTRRQSRDDKSPAATQNRNKQDKKQPNGKSNRRRSK